MEPVGRPEDGRERFMVVFEIPLVDSAQKTVQVQIIKDIKNRK